MAYTGSVDLISGIRPKNNGSFPLVDAKDIYVDDTTRLNALIPRQASPDNKLTDKDFVNSSIATNTATFRGTYNLVTDLGLTEADKDDHAVVSAAIATHLASLVPPVVADNNDYCFVLIPQSALNEDSDSDGSDSSEDAQDTEVYGRIDRYKFMGADSGDSSEDVPSGIWEFEFSLNNSSFTAAQWAAINSGITSDAAEKIRDLPTAQQFEELLAKKAPVEDVQAIEKDLALRPAMFDIGGGVWVFANDGEGFLVINGEVTTLPASKTRFMESEYDGNQNLSFVYAPNVTTIGNSAFATCSSLTSVSLSSATTIGGEAFIDCDALTSVSLLAATNIGDSAFFYCPSLTTLDLSSFTVAQVQENASTWGINPPSGHTVTITCSDGTYTITGD